MTTRKPLVQVSGTIQEVPAADTLVTPALSVTGNTTLGDAAGDTVTLNAGTVTLNNDLTVNRNWGTAPASAYYPNYFSATGAANAATYPIFPWYFETWLTGSENPGYLIGIYGEIYVGSTGGSLVGMAGFYGEVGFSASASGTYTEVNGSAADVYFSGATTAVATFANSYSADGVYFPSTGGTVGTSAGFRAQPEIGHASKISTATYGFISEHLTIGTTPTVVAFESQQNSGTGVWGFRASGTANNAFNGNVRIGSTTAPTVALDVTGSMLISGTVNKITFTQPATAATLTLTNNTTVTGPASSGTLMTLENTETVTGIKTLNATNSTTTANLALSGTNSYDGPTIHALNITTALSGGATTGAMRGITLNATFNPAVAGMTNYGHLNIVAYNNANPPTTHLGFLSRTDLGASALGGTITDIRAFNMNAPTINAAATTNITSHTGFFAGSVTQGALQTITNVYAFQGAQASGTGRWNCYMSGTANNAFRGNTRFGGITAPVATVDITGTLNVTGNTTLGDAVTDTTTVSGTVILPKTSGYGIKVDTATPTFPWHDILGPISIRGVGASDPSYNVYQGSIRGYQFDSGEEAYIEFHIPHDYVPGSDIYIHAHWSVKQTTTAGVATNAVTGGSVTWGFEVTYAKGHNQAAFITPITTTVTQNASTTQYQHMIAEVQLSAASPSASQIDSDNIEVDGLILVRAYLSANNITVSAGNVPAPFLHMVDIHYQSTNIGTKQKAPNFYT